MAINLGINGFGRIGRLVFRIAASSGSAINIVGINDVAEPEVLAHLLRYDSVHGRYSGTVECQNNNLIVDGREIPIFCERDPSKLPWSTLGATIVLESCGQHLQDRETYKHIEAGAERVIVSSFTGDADTTIVVGVNDQDLMPAHKVISASSCTTNCLAPLAKVLNDNFGLEKGLVTTVHAFTNDQAIIDSPHRDMRRGRAATSSLIPTSTGAAQGVGVVLPELAGKLDGMAVRAPVPDGSLLDLVAHLERPTTIEEVNNAFSAAASSSLFGIVDVSSDPIVGCDIIGQSASAIVDLASTNIIGGDLVKVVAWYDNEWGYANRCVDLVRSVSRLRGLKAA